MLNSTVGDGSERSLKFLASNQWLRETQDSPILFTSPSVKLTNEGTTRMVSRVLLFVLLTMEYCFSQVSATQEIGGWGKFRVDVDYARFKGNDSVSYVEIYYAVPENALTYKAMHDGFRGGSNMDLIVRRGKDSVAFSNWTMPNSMQDTSSLHLGRNVIGFTSVVLQPGTYSCEFRATDFYDPKRSDTTRFDVMINLFPLKREFLSDIELASSIRQIPRDTTNIFYKNTYEVIPNSTSLYGNSIPSLFYYFESYNLIPDPVLSYRMEIIVSDASGKEVFKQQKMRHRASTSSVEVGTVSVAKLPGGSYTLGINLVDTATSGISSTSKKFYVYKPSITEARSATSERGMLASEFAVMEEVDLDKDFAPTRYISTDEEKKRYDNLKQIKNAGERLTAKREFMYDFWKRRQFDTGTSIDFKQQYRSRVISANENFASGFKNGWESERGRVIVLYGSPDEIERFPSSGENVPYEIWRYHTLQGGAEFIFADRTGYGNWELLHSSVRNEIHDLEWTRYIRK